MKEFEDILEEISHNLEWCDDAYQSRCYRRSHDEITRLRADLAAVTEERDALAARLAPVDDEALVEIAAKVLQRGSQLEWSVLPEEWKNDWRRDARVAIAAIRPHVEAAERERCAKIADSSMLPCDIGGDLILDRYTADTIAAAIRRGK